MDYILKHGTVKSYLATCLIWLLLAFFILVIGAAFHMLHNRVIDGSFRIIPVVALMNAGWALVVYLHKKRS